MHATFADYGESGYLAGVGNTLKSIGSKAYSIGTDTNWGRAAIICMGVTSRTLECIGDGADAYVPLLALVTISPINLITAVKKAIQHFHTAFCAFSVKQFADGFYFSNRAFCSVGMTLNIVVKPLAGGVTITKIGHIAPISFTMVKVLPIVQIAISTLTGFVEAWTVVRTVKELRRFNHRVSQLDGSIAELEKLLIEMQNPSERNPTPSAADVRLWKLQTALYEDHFSLNSRRGEFQAELNQLLKSLEKSLYEYYDADSHQAAFALLEADLAFCEGLLEENPAAEILQASRDDLLLIKTTFMTQGHKLISSMRAEMHRKLIMTTISLMLSATSIASGLLFFLTPQYHNLAVGLSLGSVGVEFITILFEKLVSRERYDAFDRRFFQKPHAVQLANAA